MNISKIEGSLQQGRFFTGYWMIFIYISLAIMLLLPAITILMLIITLTVGMEWNAEMIGALIGCNIFVGFIIVIFARIIVRDKKLKHKVNIWLEDAVQIKAYSKTIDFVQLGIQPKQFKIQVSFTVNEKNYSRVSAGKMFGGGPEGYHKIWAYYADREINILYSEKYDQVLILKNN